MLGLLWLISLMSALCFGAGRDLRLLEAVKNQNKQLARVILAGTVDVNQAQNDGANSLHWAAHWQDLETAELLIRAGINVNAATDLGVSALHLACINRDSAMVQKLLMASANPNAVLSDGQSVLMTCARTGDLDSVKKLLASGADVNAKESLHGQTALMWAVSQRHPDVVQVLVDHGADIHARTRINKEFIVRKIPSDGESLPGKSPGVWIATGGSTPLLFAARVGDAASARILLAAKADPNETAPDENSALLIAAHGNHTAVAKLLLEKGADPNSAGGGYTPLHCAVLRDNLELVTALLAHGANPNSPLTNGTPVRRRDSDALLPANWIGATPFFLAAKFVEEPIMRALVAAGANPSTPIKNGTTPLMAAVGVGWEGGFDRRGANLISAPAPDEKEAMQAVKFAIELGSDVNAANRQGDTALHGAVAKGYADIVQLLVEKGARLDAKNEKGQTPLAMTKRGPSSHANVSLKDTEDLLRKLGAKE